MNNGGLLSNALMLPTYRRAGIRSPQDKLSYTTGAQRTYFWPASSSDPSYASTVGLWYFQPQDIVKSTASSQLGGGLRDYSFVGTNVLRPASSAASGNNPFLDTESPLWGQTSGHSGGANMTGWQCPDIPAFGTGDFTIEIIGYSLNFNTTNLIDNRSTDPQLACTVYTVNPGNTINYYVNGADRINSAAGVLVAGRFMLALSRNSGNTRLYYGAFSAGGSIPQVGATYVDGNNYIQANGFVCGGPLIALVNVTNWLFDAIRITKGVGRYAGSSFTAPSEPFPPY